MNRVDELHRLKTELAAQRQELQEQMSLEELHQLFRNIGKTAAELQYIARDFAEHQSYILSGMSNERAKKIYWLAIELKNSCRGLKLHAVRVQIGDLLTWLDQAFTETPDASDSITETILADLITQLMESGPASEGLPIIRKIHARVIKINRESEERNEEVRRLKKVIDRDMREDYDPRIKTISYALRDETNALDELFKHLLALITWCDYLTGLRPEEGDSLQTPVEALSDEARESRHRKYLVNRENLLKSLRSYVRALELARTSTADTLAKMY